MSYLAIRTHEICMAHRLVGHKGGCERIHGHNYVLELEVERCANNTLDSMGMVFDFGDIKAVLCSWLDENWDHRLMLWEDDPLIKQGNLHLLLQGILGGEALIAVPFNPTAENMADHLLKVVFPALLREKGLPLTVSGIRIHETGKCAVYNRLKPCV